jgi:methionyl-tRNA synthetase
VEGKPTGGGAGQPQGQGPAAGTIGFDEFAKVEMKVGLVQAVEKVQGADRLLRMTVDTGEPEPRTIVAGIAQAYPDPQALAGKRIVVVTNLAPRVLRGIASRGMLLAAGEPPNLSVVTVEGPIPPGTPVR